MEEMILYTLGDIVNVNTAQYSPKDTWIKALYLDTGNITENKIDKIQEFDCSSLPSRARRKVKHGDIIYSTVRPNQKHYGYITNPAKNLLVSTGFTVLSPHKDLTDSKFIYYWLSQNKIVAYLHNLAEQSVSAYPSIKASDICELEIKLPSLEYQTKAANILSSLDSKIELNRRINDNLEQQAQALFKSWFVDFEPFKDGKFVDSELGMIPEGWRVGNLLDIAKLYDAKRKPLSSRERENMKKLYPYYGATSIMDYVDKYIFDGTYLLMGEDGSVMDDKGHPYLQYVFGKFWPNNHAHIMQGKNNFSTEMLHCLLLKKNISPIVTGAVQAKISQSNMRKILIIQPPHEITIIFSSLIKPIYEIRKKNELENQRLSILRDTLLPKLMSGELKINDINN